MLTPEIIGIRIRESIALKEALALNKELHAAVCALSEECTTSIRNNHKFIICGNGGSASDALHFAGEIIGRFQKHRNPWPAIVLNADVASMTAISNDYGYEEVFARQAEAHCQPGDIFIGISTSGNSENVYRSIKVAKEKGSVTAALLGGNGGKIASIVDHPIVVPSDVTARIQECHILLIHIICELVENGLCERYKD